MTNKLVALVVVGALACGGNAMPDKTAAAFEQALPSSCKEETHEHACAAWVIDQLVVGAFGSYDDHALESYVSSVGHRVARVADPSRRHSWIFQVLDDKDVAAYAQLAGRVYVTRGALAVLGSEAQLAALLAHEVAHVVAGHSEQFFQRLGTAPAEHGEFRAFERDRDDERQADELAVHYLGLAGYDPQAMATMLRVVHAADSYARTSAGHEQTQNSEQPDISDWRRTHPPLQVRLARAKLAAGNRRGEQFRDRYLDQIDRLVLGDDPRTGYASGESYVHLRGRLALALDESWSAAMTGVVFRAKRDELRFALMPTTRLYAAGIEAGLVTPRKRVWATFRATLGWYAADAGVRRLAIVETPTGLFALVMTGPSRAEVAPVFSALLGEVRAPSADAPVRLRRIKLTDVRRRGTVAALAAKLCRDADLTVVLEGGDPRSPRARGDRLKCTE